MAVTFAFASTHSSTVRFFDASGQWTPEVKQFPQGIGKLVDSGGELLFFVKIMKDASPDASSPPVEWAQVSTRNPFTNHIKSLPRPHSTTKFPILARVQVFPSEYFSTNIPLPENLLQVRYFHLIIFPPLRNYFFTMVSVNNEGKYVWELYLSRDALWRPAEYCDGSVIRDVVVNGLYPPSIVFRHTDTGSLLKFGAPGDFFQPIPNPHAHDPFAKLDHAGLYVFLLSVPESVQALKYVLQVERHVSREAPDILFSSPEIELRHADAYKPFVFGAETGALVVERVQRPASNEFDFKIHLCRFDSGSWIEVQSPLSMEFHREDFNMAFLCQNISEEAGDVRNARSGSNQPQPNVSFSGDIGVFDFGGKYG